MLKINGMLYLAKISSGALSCFQQGLTFVLIIIIVSLSTLGEGHIWSRASESHSDLTVHPLLKSQFNP